MPSIAIEQAGGHEVEAIASALAAVLIDTVEGGASVGWIEPPTSAEAELWWSGVLTDPESVTWLARDGERILGTITLVRASKVNGRTPAAWPRACTAAGAGRPSGSSPISR